MFPKKNKFKILKNYLKEKKNLHKNIVSTLKFFATSLNGNSYFEYMLVHLDFDNIAQN